MDLMDLGYDDYFTEHLNGSPDLLWIHCHVYYKLMCITVHLSESLL